MLAGAIVGVQRDVRELRRDVARLDEAVTSLSIAVTGHNDRLDHIEERLGIERPNRFPPT